MTSAKTPFDAWTSAWSGNAPLMADPSVVGEALTTLLHNAGDAVRASMKAASTPGALPYDPTTFTNAMIAFNTAVMTQPAALFEAQARAWNDWTALWRTMGEKAMGMETQPVAAPARGDRRFSDAAWTDEPVYDFLKQSYLLAAKQMQEFVASAPVDDVTRNQVDFASRQVINALAPTNFAATNPEVARRTIESGGLNLVTGLSNLLEDVARGQGLVSRRTAPHEFELGTTVAATPGAVVLKTDLFELIQYAPTTETVYRRPLLFVPPLVNKFYLFDLTPKASYLKWLVDQGHTVFVISWVNPDAAHADVGMDSYVKDGVVAAIDGVRDATGEADVDLVSFCLGGTLTAMAMAWLAQTGQGERVVSATLIAALVDFSDMGEWAVFTGENDLKAFDGYLDERGYVEAHDLTKLFATVRANDLIWSSVVSHYLLGDEQRPSDLLWWFDDGSRMPARFLKEYGREVLQRNRLKDGGVVIDGVALDLKAITAPVMLVALKDDHVSAWKATYRQRVHFGGETRFILGGSGHNAGVINPPAANKHGYWLNDAADADPDAWLAGAEQKPGSWWPEWQGWLDAAAGAEMVAAREPGTGKLKAGVAAPGDYVRVRH